jgi:hypothetical protein
MTLKNDDQNAAIKAYLARIGSKGGKARAKKFDSATLSAWAKKGGRPPKKAGKS